MPSTQSPCAVDGLLFDNGNHWQSHGVAAQHQPHGNPAPTPGLGSAIDVYSYFKGDAPRRSHAPHVMLCSPQFPADGFFHLTPDSARELARTLWRAAYTADSVAEAISLPLALGKAR